MHSGLVPIKRDCFERRSPDRTNPLLGTLSKNTNRLADRINVSHFQRHQLGKPQAARIKEFEDRFVPACHPSGSLFVPQAPPGLLKQAFGLSARQKPGKLFFPFRHIDTFYYIGIKYVAY